MGRMATQPPLVTSDAAAADVCGRVGGVGIAASQTGGNALCLQSTVALPHRIVCIVAAFHFFFLLLDQISEEARTEAVRCASALSNWWNLPLRCSRRCFCSSKF